MSSPALGVRITAEIAEALYTALVTDTGRFQYANTTPRALRLAADLVESGADVHRVFQGVYESVQFAKLKLLARALERAPAVSTAAASSSRTWSRRTSARSARSEPYSEGVIDFLRGRRGRTARRSHSRAAARGRTRPEDLTPLVVGRDRRLGDRTQVRRWRAPPGSGFLERARDLRDHGVHPARVRAVAVDGAAAA